MKTFLYLALLMLPLIHISCSDDETKETQPTVELEIEHSNIALQKDKSQTVKILSGNGGYSATSSNKDVVTARIENNVVTITSTTKEDRAEAVIIITDSKYKRATIDVKISREFELVVDKEEISLEIGIEGKDETDVFIKEGNLDYQIDIVQNEDIIEIDTSILKTKNRFTVIGLAEGQAQIKITDALGKTALIDVIVELPESVSIDKSSILFSTFQKSETIKITGGEKTYKAIVENPMLIYTEIKDDELYITSFRNGKTTIVIEDAKGQKSETIDIEVNAPVTAMNLGTSYFCHADFSSIAAVDMSIKSCEQVTFEMTCKMTGYRGLQTFMGLEGNLIIRGKNDDYRETHPIEIAGLGDQIKLESTSSFNLNEWMHIALVVNCKASSIESKYKLFINGMEDKLIVVRNDKTHDRVNLVSSSDDNRFEIGRAFGQDWRAMQGVVSEARVWTTIRTESQIKENMCTLNEKDPQGLLAYWVFSANNNTNYIQDANGGKYSTNLTISDIKGNYSAVEAPKSVFVESGCPQ